MERILVDKDGYQQFYQEIEKIKEELTNNASKGGEAYKDAIGDGWHDNFAFESAMAEERKIRSKLEKMYSEQNKLEIIDMPIYEDNKVNIKSNIYKTQKTVDRNELINTLRSWENNDEENA